MTDTFFADISRYQHVIDSTYPGEMIAFRADSGFDTDPNAEANWAYCRTAAKIQAVIAYVVFIPGAVAETVGRVKHLFGPVCPAKVVFEVDDESGKGFAGPGDHSTELNQLVALLDAYSGAEARELEYGNRGDLAAGWSAAPGWLKRITAAYTGTDPKSFGWQYYGGVASNPVPAGYPTSWPPFGSAVDMNVIHLPIDAIVAALGLAPEDDMTPADWTKINAGFKEINDKIDALSLKFTEPNAQGVRVGVSEDTIVAEATGRHIDGLTSAVSALTTKVNALIEQKPATS